KGGCSHEWLHAQPALGPSRRPAPLARAQGLAASPRRRRYDRAAGSGAREDRRDRVPRRGSLRLQAANSARSASYYLNGAVDANWNFASVLWEVVSASEATKRARCP